MKSGRQLAEEILTERYAEHKALRLVNGANSTHCATINNFPLKCTVLDKKGNAIELHFSNICNEKPWKKYITQLSAPIELGVLTNNAGMIAVDIVQWFLSGGYSERYTYIKSRRARRLLRSACLLMVVTHIMEQKYKDHGFVDHWAEHEMGDILTAQAYTDEIHKATSHAKKHEEDLSEAQEAIYRKYITLLEGRKSVAYEALPSLPAGVPDPLAMPDEQGDDEDPIEDEQGLGGIA